MKFIASLILCTELIAVALAQVKIQNANVEPDLVIPNSYIIKYKPDASVTKKKKHEEIINEKAKNKGKEGVVNNIDIGGFKGYIAEIPSSELKEIIESDLVESIEKDTIVSASGIAAPLTKRKFTTQSNVPWGLARISETYKPGGLGTRYTYDTTAGAGITVYVLDSGIRTSHKEFEGRAIWGTNFVNGSSNTDEFGHGTHVAGTIGGKTYGVAKGCTMIAVKVLDKDGLGTMSGIIQGLQWAVDDAKSRGITKKAVINASLGGLYTQAANEAVKVATKLGITFVAAAGNFGDDAAYYSPGSAPSAITVGSVDGVGYRNSWSNYGAVVDIFAPGGDILSAGHLTDSSSVYRSGTSMAAPHVAGLAAYFMAKEGLRGSTAVKNRIIAASRPGVIGAMGSPERVAYNGGSK